MRTSVLFAMLSVLAVFAACYNRKDERAPPKGLPPCVIVTNTTEHIPAITNPALPLVSTNSLISSNQKTPKKPSTTKNTINKKAKKSSKSIPGS